MQRVKIEPVASQPFLEIEGDADAPTSVTIVGQLVSALQAVATKHSCGQVASGTSDRLRAPLSLTMRVTNMASQVQLVPRRD